MQRVLLINFTRETKIKYFRSSGMSLNDTVENITCCPIQFFNY